jgi:hypothetical protein
MSRSIQQRDDVVCKICTSVGPKLCPTTNKNRFNRLEARGLTAGAKDFHISCSAYVSCAALETNNVENVELKATSALKLTINGST